MKGPGAASKSLTSRLQRVMKEEAVTHNPARMSSVTLTDISFCNQTTKKPKSEGYKAGSRILPLESTTVNGLVYINIYTYVLPF